MTAVNESFSAISARLEDIRATDPAVQYLNIELADVRLGKVVMTMPVTEMMANGHGICHGGYLFTLADSTLAYCCITVGSTVVTRNAEITFIAPAHVGQTVTATATQRVNFGRNQICEVVLEVNGTVIAYFTGQGTIPTRLPERTAP